MNNLNNEAVQTITKMAVIEISEKLIQMWKEVKNGKLEDAKQFSRQAYTIAEFVAKSTKQDPMEIMEAAETIYFDYIAAYKKI